jgi:hypothetical protein
MTFYTLISVLALVLGIPGIPGDPGIQIGPLKNQKIVEDCGGYFSLSTDENKLMVFVDDLADTAWLNINGRDTRLVLLRSTQTGKPEKLGDRFSEFYQGGGFDVQVDFTITFVCPPGEEGCEHTGMDGFVTVRRGKSKSSILVSGGRGC